MRGINIGYVKSLKMDLNSILVLVHIKSPHILIPKDSIIETNQIGIFSDFVIDIVPLKQITLNEVQLFNVFNKQCHNSKFLCHANYIYGYKGLNYDDLIRASTRIAQRFDDPRLYELCYIIFNNLIEISNDFNFFTSDLANISYLIYYIFKYFLFNLFFINYE
uniref:Hypothetical chloroplast RF22 n=1 Tax=Gastroclonium compressum TaxID=1852973 RepID=A0A173FZW7_GASCM|nr:hypothetical chloroplast RF22 [Coeloseira compressa]ANH09574.1 hypothetical chloroplast RF22 [Coeloseira compressa]